LWGHDPAHVAALARDRENRRNLPGLPLAAAVAPTADLAELKNADIVLGVVPAQAMRAVAKRARAFLRDGAAFVVCAKGIERSSHKFMSEVIAEEAPQVEVAALSGPSFASDVCKGLPTAVTLACSREALGQNLAEQLSTKTFRLYRSTDLRGVEIGGAAKNVLAIACGMAAGRELGASAQAALMGLSGLGDLVLTCGSVQSRNFALGQALGRGEPPREASHGKLAEGAYTASALAYIARERRVEMPIAEAVDAILAGRLSVEAAIDALLMRPLRAEA
jgi:glycerol-3-phosphate dehydrogenase (NAD(P)+)